MTFSKTLFHFSQAQGRNTKRGGQGFRRFCAAGGLAVLCFGGVVQGQPFEIYRDTRAPIDSRVDDLMRRVSQAEKLSLLGGTGFTTQPIARLGVPPMAMVDAGQGVRGGMDSTQGPATAFPCGAAMGSTWDVELLHRLGEAIGEEARNKGTGSQVLLGPAVNIHRTPLGGRNGEYVSEDPFLTARLAVAYIQGMQDTGVAACIKHFACNNQEHERFEVNATVGERALREIYLPAFEAGVKEGKVWTLMSSYNKVNSLHASANPALLTDILKREWGFDGLVMSDWGGVHEAGVVQAGNDLEMPTGYFMSVSNLTAAIASGRVTQAAVDDSVRRILRTVVRTGLLDGPMKLDASKVNSPEHARVAYEVAAKGTVLLKNQEGVLPLERAKVKSIAVVGEPARKLQLGALGSPEVKPLKAARLLDELQRAGGKDVAIRYVPAGREGELMTAAWVRTPDSNAVPGFRAEYFKNEKLEGAPALARVEPEINIEQRGSPAPGIEPDHFSVRWTGRLSIPATGKYQLSFTADDGCRLYVDDKLVLERWSLGRAEAKRAEVEFEAGKTYAIRAEFFQAGGDCVARLNWQPTSQPAYAEAVAAAKAAEVAVVCVSTLGTEGEGSDRPAFELPDEQAALIRAVAAANPRTIVLLNTGTPVEFKDWIDQAPAALECWFPGQEGAAAVADILFGQVNPSGKLPDTFAVARHDYPDAQNYPGRKREVNYAEGLYVGYRYFDKAGIRPVFPFGHGLSYTSYTYSNLRLSSTNLARGGVTVSVDIANTGKREGEEVAQLYLQDLSPRIDRPARELKGFARVALKPGEKKTVTFGLTPRSAAYFDVASHQWKADAGDYEAQAGPSSRELPLRGTLTLGQTYTEQP
jgi:beta-glucosidase